MPEKTHVLVVDDDVNFCDSISKILIKKGYDVSSAHSGFKALEVAEEKALDIVLMDIKMPVMDGVETYKRLKAIRPSIKVILMSAFSIDDLIKDALREGVYAVVRKPFEIETIVNMIERAKLGALVAIVDDDPEICKSMKSSIERKGYHVSTCLTGKEAISMAKEIKYDVYFIDMKMPALNGLEVYLEIRKIDPKATVVFMTAYRQEMDALIKQIADNGAYTCLYKPFDIDEVLKIIDGVAKRIHNRER